MDAITEFENLFDACDTANLGKVPVSKLIMAVTNEVNAFNNNDHQQHEKEELLDTVRCLLDPSDQDIQVDKATWMAAWYKQAESPSPKKSKVYNISDLAGGDDLGIGDEFQGPLDVSKHSYCFSPGSRSSSLEDSEEVVQLKEEIQQLQCSLKTQKQQLQKLDDALNQEQIEKQELEKLKDVEVNKMSRQIKSLLESNESLKCSLEVSESEKLELCKSCDSLSVTERQLNLQLTEQKRVVAELCSEVEDLNQQIENLKSDKQELENKLEQQANAQQEQMMDYQKTIQNYLDEKSELNFQITNSMLHKRHLSTYSDDLDCSDSSNLQSELAPFHFQANSLNLSDSPPALQKSLLIEMQAAVSCDAETQTQDNFNVTPLTPLKTIDKCIQAEFASKELVVLKEEIQQLHCTLKNEKLEVQRLHDALCQEQIVKQELEKVKDDEVNKLSKQIKTLLESNEVPKGSLEVSESEKIDLYKSLDSPSVTERQLNLQLNEQNQVLAALSTEIENLNQENGLLKSNIKELQTKLEVQGNVYQEQRIDHQKTMENHQYEKNEQSPQITSTLNKSLSAGLDDLDCKSSRKTQSEPAHFSLQANCHLSNSSTSQLEKSLLPEVEMKAMSCHADAQTQGVFNVPSHMPTERVDKSIQAEVEMCPVETQTSPHASEKDYKLCLPRYLTKYFFQKLPPTNATEVAIKSPDLSLRILDEQSSVHKKFSSVLPHKSRCLWVIFTLIIFLVLLVISTIFCTGAVLQIASDAGLLSYPYAGPSSDFVKRIIKPLVKTNLRPRNVPV
ncbi:girdin-like isoform X2 [Thrips palmi]|uniref:Girdin-like isoform X2 n=1 Tax=Thrips palmi TaxID=161013 RepID=A0A6P8Y6Z2_THRPL|nr:girdin-like isoform X2 [Thrips palmi]